MLSSIWKLRPIRMLIWCFEFASPVNNKFWFERYLFGMYDFTFFWQKSCIMKIHFISETKAKNKKISLPFRVNIRISFLWIFPYLEVSCMSSVFLLCSLWIKSFKIQNKKLCLISFLWSFMHLLKCPYRKKKIKQKYKVLIKIMFVNQTRKQNNIYFVLTYCFIQVYGII